MRPPADGAAYFGGRHCYNLSYESRNGPRPARARRYRLDAHPLLSRCAKIELDYLGLAEPFAEHCQRIATAEDLNGKGLGEYIKLAQRCKGDCREMLMKIEAREML